ncbi:MAG: hypothetical protein WEB58_13910 [Planctomycetaceae bacterium]
MKMITEQQIKAAEQGQTIRVHAGVEFVLIRADVYDRLTNASDVPETYPAIIAALGDEAPDQYLEYLNESKARWGT